MTQPTLSRNLMFALSLGLLFSACATTHRGSIVMKVNNRESHVGMGKGEVKVGDHVQLYHHICSGVSKEDVGGRTCRKEFTGHGEVTHVLNDHYSVVTFPEGTKFSEGDTIEKHGH